MAQPPSPPISSSMTPEKLLREATTLSDNIVKLDNKLKMAKLKGFRRRLMIVRPRKIKKNNDTSIGISPGNSYISDMNDYDTSRLFSLSTSTTDSSKSSIQNDTSSTTTDIHTLSDGWSNISSPNNSVGYSMISLIVP
jgi:hypothetical protein